MTPRRGLRLLGLLLVVVGALCVVGSSFLPWVDVRGFEITLWELTTFAVVVVVACGFAALALAALALTRGGRELPAAAAAALLAGLTLPIVDDVEASPDDLQGAGAAVAAAGALMALLGLVLVVLAADSRPPRAARLAAGALALLVGLAVGQNALEVHPEIQIIR